MFEIAAVVAVVSEWAIIPKVDREGGVKHMRIVIRVARWQEFLGGVVDDAAFVAAAPRVAMLFALFLYSAMAAFRTNTHSLA